MTPTEDSEARQMREAERGTKTKTSVSPYLLTNMRMARTRVFIIIYSSQRGRRTRREMRRKGAEAEVRASQTCGGESNMHNALYRTLLQRNVNHVRCELPALARRFPQSHCFIFHLKTISPFAVVFIWWSPVWRMGGTRARPRFICDSQWNAKTKFSNDRISIHQSANTQMFPRVRNSIGYQLWVKRKRTSRHTVRTFHTTRWIARCRNRVNAVALLSNAVNDSGEFSLSCSVTNF